MTERDEAVAHRFHLDIFCEGRLEVADEILQPDFVIHGPGVGPEFANGPEGTKRYAEAIRGGFGGKVRIDHHDTFSSGDRVAIRWSSSGIHDGDLMGVPPTGRQVEITGIDIFRLKDGKLAEMWQNWDQLGLLQQIGAVPQPETAAAR
jgi:predicted SnoaL-like aldol condensation-catalyzing enzyme